MPGFYDAVYEIVRKIPSGSVTTYGTVATLIGSPGNARAVGYALRSLPEGTNVPWHRVINAQGRISLRSRLPESTDLQHDLLVEEGVVFSDEGTTSLETYGWWGDNQLLTEC